MEIIQGIFELHLEVTNLEEGMKFYGETLGFKLGLYEEGRRRAFFLLGQEQVSMFSIVERKEPNLRHYAFRIAARDLDTVIPKLQALGIELVPGWTGASTDEPIVFPWLPAASVFFNDPAGNRVELLAMLPDAPRADIAAPYVTLSEWNRLHA